MLEHTDASHAVPRAVVAFIAIPVLPHRARCKTAVNPKLVAVLALQAVPLITVLEEMADPAMLMTLELLRCDCRCVHPDKP